MHHSMFWPRNSRNLNIRLSLGLKCKSIGRTGYAGLYIKVGLTWHASGAEGADGFQSGAVTDIPGAIAAHELLSWKSLIRLDGSDAPSVFFLRSPPSGQEMLGNACVRVLWGTCIDIEGCVLAGPTTFI